MAKGTRAGQGTLVAADVEDLKVIVVHEPKHHVQEILHIRVTTALIGSDSHSSLG